MAPRKASKSSRKKATPARRAKAASRKKASRKKPARKSPRTRVRTAPRRKGEKPAAAAAVDTLGDWQHDHDVDTQQYTEDDIPPDYGGSE